MESPASLIPFRMGPVKRTVKKVPFVELLNGRVQGVVSSGSDIKRVYVSFVESESGDYYCCTNNNRPCGGLRGSPCKHIHSMIDEAILQFGAKSVASYLRIDIATDAETLARDVLAHSHGTEKKESPGVVFSRFLNYLRYCELETTAGRVLEMNWFVS